LRDVLAKKFGCTQGTGTATASSKADILVATGRTPNTDGMGIEQTGVELNKLGYIKVNYWRTSPRTARNGQLEIHSWFY